MGKGVAEREINLWDMLWAVCLKWRSILACAIIFTILAGGFSYYKSLQNVQTVVEEKTLEEVADSLSYEEKKNADVYLAYSETYNQQMKYNTEAPLMRLDANAFYVNRITLYIDNHFEVEYPMIEKNNNIRAIIGAYKLSYATEEVSETIAEIYQCEENAGYALEMIDCSASYGDGTYIANDYDNGLLTIAVYASEKETCLEVSDIIIEKIKSEKSAVEKQFSAHDLKVLAEDVQLVSDSELIRYQKEEIDKAQTMSTHMTNMESKFGDAQKEYIQMSIDSSDEDRVAEKAEAEPVTANKPNISKKMLVLGFVAGAFLAFAMWALLYMLSGKIRLEEDFEAVYKTKLLGNIPMESNRKRKWFEFIDRIFIGLRHLNRRYFEKEKAYEMVAANIRIGLKGTENKNLMVSGAICGDDEKKVVEELAKRLKKDDIKLEYASQILYNAESLEKMVEVGQVIFVERAEQSLYQEVLREIEICEQQNVKVLGCIVIY